MDYGTKMDYGSTVRFSAYPMVHTMSRVHLTILAQCEACMGMAQYMTAQVTCYTVFQCTILLNLLSYTHAMTFHRNLWKWVSELDFIALHWCYHQRNTMEVLWPKTSGIKSTFHNNIFQGLTLVRYQHIIYSSQWKDWRIYALQVAKWFTR